MTAPRIVLALMLCATIAAPAQAQLLGSRKPALGEPPPDATPYEALVWPYPAPDPNTWWNDDWPKAPEAADPLGGRRLGRSERLVAVDNGLDPSTYRLWGLMPLQWQVVRGGEMILEVWVRPSRTVRQGVIRVVVKRGGEVFVQGRAGYACCEADIARRFGFDYQMPAGSAARFLALRDQPFWASPREVVVAEAGGAADAICVDGTAYDLTLVVQGQARVLRRACDPAEIGQVADALEAAVAGALGRDPRFDLLFPTGADFSSARRAYRSLVESGGGLKPDPQAKPTAAGYEPMPQYGDDDQPSNPQPQGLY